MNFNFIVSINGGPAVAKFSSEKAANEFVKQIHGTTENYAKLVNEGYDLIITIADKE